MHKKTTVKSHCQKVRITNDISNKTYRPTGHKEINYSELKQ